MVYVNDKKFACESCIKGHRSSSCHHTDRPLFEIKKKGRPVSQCTKCRELRQSKKVHSKCTCDNSGEKARQVQLVPLSANSKSRRYIPIVPALPNGLKDVLGSSKSSAAPADQRQRVDSLLNPCCCPNVRNCKCQTAGTSTSPPPPLPPPTASVSRIPNSLDALAQAASIRCNEERTTSGPSLGLPTRAAKIPRPRPHSPQQQMSRKRAKASAITNPDQHLLLDMRIIAPPPSLPIAYPNFATLPPPGFGTACVGTGCTCGMQCSCPGCVEHRGAVHVSREHRDCAEGCGTCVDRTTTELRLNPTARTWETSAPSFELPPSFDLAPKSVSTSVPMSFVDQFFARAAALPPPPASRRGVALDPTDTSVPPEPVQLPKLECCGGACMCPSGKCSCRSSCGGACLDDHVDEAQSQSPQPVAAAAVKPAKSCCAGKAKPIAT